jgi:AcrR family transcriptional regulator
MRERRRGAELEAALLEAAWLELAERGYAGLTMEGVAARAGTSRPVLARRWSSTAALAIAAIRRELAKHPMAVTNTGDLRSELLEYLDRASERAQGIAAAFSVFASGYFQETDTTPQDFREAIGAGGNDTLVGILRRAADRGEVAAESLIPPVSTLLSDLFRYHAIMTFAPPSPELRTAWVDTIFLPLVRDGRDR